MLGYSVPLILSCLMKQLDTVLRGLFQASFFFGLLRRFIGRVLQNCIDTLNSCINDLQTVTKGDVNGDCRIRLQDAVIVQRYLLNITSFDDRMFYCADFNNDGTVSLSDVILIQQYIIQN